MPLCFDISYRSLQDFNSAKNQARKQAVFPKHVKPLHHKGVSCNRLFVLQWSCHRE